MTLWIVVLALIFLLYKGSETERPIPEQKTDSDFEWENWVRGGVWKPKSHYIEQINTAAIRFGVPNAIIEAVLWVESNDGANTQGSHGEIGAMQILPSTVRDIHNRMPSTKDLSPYVLNENILLGAAYLRLNYAALGQWKKAIVAYNSGANSERVNKPEVDWYFQRVNDRLKEILE